MKKKVKIKTLYAPNSTGVDGDILVVYKVALPHGKEAELKELIRQFLNNKIVAA